jgi:esterase
MELFCRKLGSGYPFILLHGLFGSSDNWFSFGRKLASGYEVYLADLRNHGQSPHHPIHNYQEMRDDLLGMMDKLNLPDAIIMGHSMGGKAALAFALRYPSRVKKMIVIDISPFRYDKANAPPQVFAPEYVIQGLQNIDPEKLNSREEADRQLQEFIPSLAVRQFLLKNLKRTPDNRFFWMMNIPVLVRSMHEIYKGVIDETMIEMQNIPEFPLLFIKGEKSEYISKRNEEAIHRIFPWAEMVTIHNSGHWVHAEQPVQLLEAVYRFIEK